MGLETFARLAISSTEVASKPRSAKTARPTSMSWARRAEALSRADRTRCLATLTEYYGVVSYASVSYGGVRSWHHARTPPRSGPAVPAGPSRQLVLLASPHLALSRTLRSSLEQPHATGSRGSARGRNARRAFADAATGTRLAPSPPRPIRPLGRVDCREATRSHVLALFRTRAARRGRMHHDHREGCR